MTALSFRLSEAKERISKKENRMEKKFDYAKAIKELEEIAARVENPETKLDDIDALVGRSKELVKQCKEYLRGVKDKIDALDKD